MCTTLRRTLLAAFGLSYLLIGPTVGQDKQPPVPATLLKDVKAPKDYEVTIFASPSVKTATSLRGIVAALERVFDGGSGTGRFFKASMLLRNESESLTTISKRLTSMVHAT